MMEPEAAIPDSEEQPIPMVIAEPRGRARGRNSSLETVRYPSDEPPQVKPRAKSSSTTPSVAASMRASSASTVRYPSGEPPQAKARTKSGSRTSSVAAPKRAASTSTVRYPSEPPI